MQRKIARQALEARLRSPLADGEWDLLREWGNAQEIEGMLDGDESLSDALDVAVNKVRGMHRVYAAGPEGFARVAGAPSMGPKRRLPPRQHAISLLIADEASREKSVIAFRESVLGDNLLQWSEVKGWIERLSAEEVSGQIYSTALVTVPVPLGTEVEVDETGVYFTPSLVLEHVPHAQASWGSTILKYLPEGAEWQDVIKVCPGGVLDRLRRLSNMLADRYQWSESTATVFVLTGVPPLVDDVTSSEQRDLVRPVLSRIVLTVDPTVSPKRLAVLYSRWRTTALGPRYRPQTSKSLRLAVAAARGRNEGLSWRSCMREWNEKYAPEFGDKRYRDVSNFTRDALRALRRLLWWKS
jgi:hypothetical protein